MHQEQSARSNSDCPSQCPHSASACLSSLCRRLCPRLPSSYLTPVCLCRTTECPLSPASPHPCRLGRREDHLESILSVLIMRDSLDVSVWPPPQCYLSVPTPATPPATPPLSPGGVTEHVSPHWTYCTVQLSGTENILQTFPSSQSVHVLFSPAE